MYRGSPSGNDAADGAEPRGDESRSGRGEARGILGSVVAVSLSPVHAFTKPVDTMIRLLAGLCVEGDAHLGVTVQHRSRVAKHPTQPNLRQVHLIAEELHDELRQKGFRVGPGIMGIVLQGGEIRAGDTIQVELPPMPYRRLERV